MKNCQTLYEAQTANHLKEVIQPPPNPSLSDKTLLRLWNKNFLTEIYKNITRCAIKVLEECGLLGVKKWFSANVFSGSKQKYVCWNICKVRKAFGCAAGAYQFQCQVS